MRFYKSANVAELMVSKAEIPGQGYRLESELHRAIITIYANSGTPKLLSVWSVDVLFFSHSFS